MSWNTTRDFKNWVIRRGKRYAKEGQKLEDETIVRLLEKMVVEGKIVGFTHHRKNSYADWSGKDFTATISLNSQTIEQSFGVTISLKSWGDAKRLHPKTPQLCFPIGTKLETMEKRILELFKRSYGD